MSREADRIAAIRENTIDPPNFQTCEDCNGSGIWASDPYGFGPTGVCGGCDGAGGWEIEEEETDDDRPE